jgi:hypothetical protein
MAVVNNSTESLCTAVWGRRFQSTVVRGKNEAFLCCVLHSGTWYDRECMFLECLRGAESLSLLLTATLSWEILYIMTNCWVGVPVNNNHWLERNFKQRGSTISTKRTVNFHRKSFNIKKTTTFCVGKLGPGFGRAQQFGIKIIKIPYIYVI